MQQILQEIDRSKKIFIMLTRFNQEIEKYRRFLLIAKSPDQVEFLNQEIQKRNFAIAQLQAEYDALAQSARNRAATSAATSAASPTSTLSGRKNENRNNGANAELAAQVAQLESEVAAGQHGPLGSLEPEHQAIQENINRSAQQIQGLTNTLTGLRKRGGKRKTSKLRKTRKQKKNRGLK